MSDRDLSSLPTPSPERVARARRVRSARHSTLAVAVLGAIAALHFARPARPLLSAEHAAGAAAAAAAGATAALPNPPFAHLAAAAFGRSGGVRMRFTLPGDHVRVPLAVSGDPSAYTYSWISVSSAREAGPPRPLGGDSTLVAPAEPGFYRLALHRGGERQVLAGVTLSVLVPFAQKRGSTLNGYRLGTYVGERLAGAARRALPEGFFPVEEAALALPVSKHLKLGDVLTTPDTPRLGHPRYATLDERLLEKLELVLAEVERMAAHPVGPPRITVNSGFRPPAYNATVRGAARNSRHQYGDAADVKIDVNRDGRFTLDEVRLVTRAVERVERAHPDLVGGLGVYTGKRLRSPYVHIDARGERARWNGAG